MDLNRTFDVEIFQMALWTGEDAAKGEWPREVAGSQLVHQELGVLVDRDSQAVQDRKVSRLYM